MGKASRLKGKQSGDGKEADKHKRVLTSYLSRAGVVLPSNDRQLWSNVEATLGRAYAKNLNDSIDERIADDAAGRPLTNAVYDLLYRDVETASATTSFVTPMLRAWATHFQSLDLPDGPMVDLGSGSGILTCFYAALFPHREITGVEIHPGGVACGQALAVKLGLSNVQFVQGDALNFRARHRFAVVVSVAGLGEMEGGRPEPTHPFSSVRSAESIWQRSESGLARSAADLLEADGAFVPLERLSDFQDLARWSSAIQRAGLSLDLSSSTYLRWNTPPGGDEAMPALVALKQHPVSTVALDQVVNWYRQQSTHDYDDFDVELEMIEEPMLRFVGGQHFDVNDQHGSGQTRIYLLERGDGAVMYMSTSRGGRSIMLEADVADELVPEFEDVIDEFRASPQIVGYRALGPSDLAEELGRPVLP